METAANPTQYVIYSDRSAGAAFAVLKELGMIGWEGLRKPGEDALGLFHRLGGVIAEALSSGLLLAATAEAVEILKYRARAAQTPKERMKAAAAWRMLDWNVKSALGERAECWTCDDQNRVQRLAQAVGSRYCPTCLPRERAAWEQVHGKGGPRDLGHGLDCVHCRATFTSVDSNPVTPAKG